MLCLFTPFLWYPQDQVQQGFKNCPLRKFALFFKKETEYKGRKKKSKIVLNKQLKLAGNQIFRIKVLTFI